MADGFDLGDFEFDKSGGVDATALAEAAGGANLPGGGMFDIGSRGFSLMNPGGIDTPSPYTLDKSGVATTIDRGSSGGGGWGDFLKGAGDVAKMALPAGSLALGALGAFNSNKAASTLDRQSKNVERAQDVQIRGAEGAQAIAPRIEQYAPQVAAIAPRVQEIGGRLKSSVSDPTTGFGGKQLELAAQGKIPEAQQAEIDQWVQQQKALIKDYFARAGLGESTMLAEAMGEIDKQAVAMKSQGLQAEEALGLQALQQGGGAIGGEIGAEMAAADLLGTAGATEAAAAGAMTGGSSAAGGAAQTAAQQQKMLEDLIASANQQLSRLTASAS